MKLFFYTLRPFDELEYCEKCRTEFGIDYAYTTEAPNPGNLHLAQGCDAVSTNPCEIRPEYLESFAAMGVKYLPCRSIGYDHLPLATAKQLGLRVSHSHYPPQGVANYTIMLMLMVCRKFKPTMLRAEAQDFSLQGKISKDLSNCTVGVIGTGKIGCTVLRHLAGFGCRLLACDNFHNPEAAALAEYVDLDTLYAQSDIITLHTNATPENYHLIDAKALAKMKPGVMLINTARGALVDTEALVEALYTGQVGGAGLDVIEQENDICYYNRSAEVLHNRELTLLRSFPNVVLTPHTAFYTEVNVESMVRSAFEAVDDFAHGRPHACEVAL